MKDILDREIMVGDTVGFSLGGGDLGTAKVIAAASFGMQLESAADTTWIVTTESLAAYVIVAFGYGVV